MHDYNYQFLNISVLFPHMHLQQMGLIPHKKTDRFLKLVHNNRMLYHNPFALPTQLTY